MMVDLGATIKKARSEECGLPLSTIATVFAESLGDTHEVRSIINSLEDYLS